MIRSRSIVGEGEAGAPLALGLGAQVVGELQQVVAISRDGVRRQTPFALQIGEERLDALVHLVVPPRSVERGKPQDNARACVLRDWSGAWVGHLGAVGVAHRPAPAGRGPRCGGRAGPSGAGRGVAGQLGTRGAGAL